MPALGVLLAVLAVAGCAATPLSAYPDFPERKRTLGTLAVLADVTPLQDISGDLDKLDVTESQRLGQVLLSTLAGRLAEKSYAVGKTVHASVGMVLDPGAVVKVAQAGEDRDDDALPLTNPPALLDAAIAQDRTLKEAWTSVLAEVGRHASPRQGTQRTVIDGAASLGRALEADALLVVVVVGRRVPVGKQIGQAVLTGILTLGLVVVHQTSTGAMHAFVIDAPTGEILWTDRRGGQTALDENGVRRMAEDIVRALP